MSANDTVRCGRRGSERATSAAGATRAAVVDTAPFALALVPFGLATGVAARASGLSTVETLGGAVALLAGAAQLAVIDSTGRDQGIWLGALVAALINVRFVLYGAGVADWFATSSRRRRLLLVFGVVDQTFLLCQQRFRRETHVGWRQRYYLVATLVLAGSFVGSQAIALGVGDVVGDGSGLHLAAPLAFAGMLARSVDGRAGLAVAAVAALTMVATAEVLGPAALPTAVVTGVAVGLRTGTGS